MAFASRVRDCQVVFRHDRPLPKVTKIETVKTLETVKQNDRPLPKVTKIEKVKTLETVKQNLYFKTFEFEMDTIWQMANSYFLKSI